MKFYMFLLLLFFQICTATAQTSFEFILDDPFDQDQLTGSFIEDSNGNIIFSVGNDLFVKLIKLNDQGVLIDSIDILNSPNGKCDILQLLKIDDSNFLAYGKYNIDSVFNLWVVKFDYDFNILWETKIPVNGNVICTHQYSISNENENIIILSTIFSQDNFNLVLHEINNNGAIIKEKYVDGHGLASDIILMSSTQYRLIIYGSIQKTIVNIYTLDSNFNITNNYSLPWGLSSSNTMRFLGDSNLLITGRKIFPEKNNERDLGIVKTNINNNLIEYKHYGKIDTIDYPGEHNNLDFISENDIFFGGYSNINISNPAFSTLPSWFILNKIDINLNLKWQKFYGGDACYNLWSILATQDGGCVMAGTRYDYKTQPIQERDIYILKVDEDGIVTWTQEIPLTKTHTTIYPNPGTNCLNIKTKLKNSTFELIDFTGKIIIRKSLNSFTKQINTSNIPSGMYFYRIHDNKKIIESGKWVKR